MEIEKKERKEKATADLARQESAAGEAKEESGMRKGKEMLMEMHWLLTRKVLAKQPPQIKCSRRAPFVF